MASFSRDVFVDPHRATEFHTRAAASLLYAGSEAVLSGHSALVAHGCSAADPAPIHVLVPYHRNLGSRPGLLVHNGRFEWQDVTEIAGLRVLAVDVALAEVLCRGDRRSGIACADQALALLPENERAEFRAWTAERIRTRDDPRGKLRGVALLDLATGLAESPAESWLLLSLADAGLPVPQPQVQIFDIAGNVIYRLDFGWPEPRVAVEYDGYAAHENRKERDVARDEDLRRRGWTMIRADAADLKDPSRVVAAVRAAFRARGFAE
ncbi:MAG TPA: DUF559 domain-containing protein [Amycolatopsis sp.]|uniref:DUF559 domain-containing protein n=1 Tax=Amycolatopsis sp. TaxID=37632 RepID=UPI002B46A638|nr:DUF559 domain-containing protein [Amycolatopsis sp.]HKS47941.1 DUF559 domain-containing protein [Amycolatopsis sp.]